MFTALRAVFTVLQRGQRLANVEAWKHTQAVVTDLVALLGALVVAVRVFGVEIPLSEADLVAVAGAVATLGGVLVHYLTYATSDKVGLPPRRESREPDGEPGEGHNFF